MNKSLHTEVGAKRGEIEITVLVFLSAAASLYMYKYMSNHVHNDSVGAAIGAVECSECGLDSTWTRCFQASILDSKTRFSQSAVVGTGREAQSSASRTCLSSGTSHPIFKTPFGAKANCWETCMFLSCSVRTFIWKGEQPEIVGENAFFTVWAITGWKCRLDAWTNERTNAGAAPLPPRLHVAIWEAPGGRRLRRLSKNQAPGRNTSGHAVHIMRTCARGFHRARNTSALADCISCRQSICTLVHGWQLLIPEWVCVIDQSHRPVVTQPGQILKLFCRPLEKHRPFKGNSTSFQMHIFIPDSGWRILTW